MKTKKKIMLGIGRSRGVTYLLRDDFITARAAGAVNNTQAEPTGGTRTVTDSGMKLSISGGQLVAALGAAGDGNPGLWYPSVTKLSGRIFMADVISPANATFGFDANTATSVTMRFYIVPGFVYAGAAVNAGALSSGLYKYAVVGRMPTGAYYFIKGGAYTNWTLVWIDTLLNPVSYFPAISAASGSTVETIVDNVRVPDNLWLPTPIAYDSFTRASGAIGSTESVGPEGQSIAPLEWSAGEVSAQQMRITPTLGSNIAGNSGFDTDSVWFKGTGWTIGSGVASHSAGTDSLRQSILADRSWYQITVDVNAISGGTLTLGYGGVSVSNAISTTGTHVTTNRAAGGLAYVATATATVCTVDNVTVKQISLPSMISKVTTSTADVIASTPMSLLTNTQGGLIINLDDEANPLNFVIAYHDGVRCVLDKCVNGIYTNLINVAITYVSGAYITVSKSGTKYRMWYNHALVNTEQTISDASVISNTKHGIFSANSNNVFNSYELLPRGTNGEYAALDAY